ncbi:hypothetical protein ACFWUP_07580 [Nocardia sp. NPDC058658]|uniref:hypothetical protein n=1 Tax=Nocardia sp. NPDC058658 TaxID=3346580 RepID=UPI0036570C97
MTAIGKTWIGVVAGIALLVTACGGGEPQAPSAARPTVPLTTPVPPTTAVAADAPGAPAPTVGGSTPTVGAPPNPGVPTAPPTTVQPPAPATGTIVLRTVTLSGIPVPGVPVRLSLRQPCDPSSHDIPLAETTEALRLDGVTDDQGSAVFTAPTGCYHFGMTAPAGTNPVPEGMHSLFLVTPGSTVTGKLRFNDAQPASACAESTIETDLGVDPAPAATVSDCDEQWAVVRWDSPGDNQRIIRRVSGAWTTYVLFPHVTCWTTAFTDGVPLQLRSYFHNC